MKKIDLINKLQEVAPEIKVNDDHNVADLKLFLELVEKRNQVTALQDQLTHKQSELASANSEIQGLTETNRLLTLDVEELNAELAKEVAAPELPSFKIGKVAYQVVYPKIQLNGTIVTAQEVAERKELQDVLIKKGSGAIQIVES